jgi:hypothetical protein
MVLKLAPLAVVGHLKYIPRKYRDGGGVQKEAKHDQAPFRGSQTGA